MKNYIKKLKCLIYLISIVCLYFFPIQSVKASVLFEDTFSNGYNSSWQVKPGSLSPIPSTHGIGAPSSSQWSDIFIPISDNTVLDIQLDLWINIDNVNSAWRVDISNDTFTRYKIINNWGPNNLLQVSEVERGIDFLQPWTHSIGKHHFEIIISPSSNTEITVFEDGTQIANHISQINISSPKLAIGLLGIGDYELSNFSLSAPPPTSTPTPTPPPPPTKKIVVIPGVTASWNPDALLNCKLNDYAGEWTLFHLARSVYNPLLDALTKAGWLPTIYPYDWRKPVSENEPALASFINNLTPGWHEKVDIVGHSMGGLLARSYITKEQSANKAEKFLSIGSPHLGAVAAYPTWEAGQIWEGDLGWKFLLTLLKKNCSVRNKISDRTTVQSYFTSVNNLLPIFDYLTDDATGQPIHYGDMQEKNHFLTDNRFPFYQTSVATLRGTGQETTNGYRVGSVNKHDAVGDWIDGKPVSRSTTTGGDGTVLLTSSEIPDADNTRVIPVSHTDLLSSDQGIEKILGFLGAAPQTIQSVTANMQPPSPAPTSGLFVIGYPADFWIVDPDGHMTKDERNLQVFTNPKSGAYKLVLMPRTGTTRLIVAQFLSNGKILWKEYQLKNRLPKIKTIKFDNENPLEDPIQ